MWPNVIHINGKIEGNEAEVVKEYKYKTEYQPGWEEARRRCLWKQEIANVEGHDRLSLCNRHDN